MKWSFLLLVFMGCLSLVAQNRREFWSKFNTSVRINKHLSVAVDGQYRTQAAYHTNSRNLFEHKRMQSMRLWLIVKIKSNTDILISPLAGFIISDYGLANDWVNTKEIRYSAGIQKKLSLEKIDFKTRFLFELRQFLVPIKAINYRARLQMQINLPLMKIKSTEVGVVLSEEYFYRLIDKCMDNNRVLAGLQIETGRFELQSGIQWQKSSSWHSGSSILQTSTIINYNF
jgi:hypothetical protein